MANPTIEQAFQPVFGGSEWRAEGAAILAALSEAGAAVKDLYDRAAAATYAKTDGSPVTDADLAADAIIRRVLAERFPDDALLTEEGQDGEARLRSRRCWIADPIDGTQQFVERTGNFDILIALAVDGRPVVAGALQPPTDTTCVAIAGGGAWLAEGNANPVRVRFPAKDTAQPVVGTSIWFGAPENLDALGDIASRLGGRAVGESRIGFTPRTFVEPLWCDLLLGFRLGAEQFMAYEWDFAVGDLFLHEAGGALTDLDGEAFRYNRPRPTFERGLVAATSRSLHARALAATRAELAARGVAGF